MGLEVAAAEVAAHIQNLEGPGEEDPVEVVVVVAEGNPS